MKKLLALFVLAAVACAPADPPGPGPEAAGNSFLWIDPANEDDVAPVITNCSDQIEFAELSVGVEGAEAPAHFAYSIDDDGEDWEILSCEGADFSRLDNSEFDFGECEVNGDAFDSSEIDGAELKGEVASERTFDNSNCVQVQTTSLVLEDKSTSLGAEFEIVFSLQGGDCVEIEAQLEAESFNGEGVDGCRVRYTLPDFENLAAVGER